MTERVDAVAVDVGHGAGGAELEVAAHERDADRIAGSERRRRAPQPLLCASRGASDEEPAITGTKPWSRNAAATGSITAESNPPSVSGVAIGRSSVPMPALTEPSPNTCTSFGLSANGRIQLKA